MGLFEFQGAPSSRDQYENSELLFERSTAGDVISAAAVDTWENYNSIGIALHENNQYDFLNTNPESHYSRFIQDQVSVDGYFDPVEFGERHYEKVTQRAVTRMLQPEEIKQKFGHLNMKSDKPMAMYQLQSIAESRRAAAKREDVFTRSEGGFTTGALSFGTALAVSIVDPVNLAIGLIPVAGQAKWAQVIGRAGLLSRKAFNLGRRAVGARALPLAPIRTFGQLGKASQIGIRASSGAVENVLLDTPIELALADYRLEHKLQDTTTEELIMAVSMSAIIGGFLRPLGGAISDFKAHRALVRNKKVEAEVELLREDIARVDASKNKNATLTDKHSKATQETLLETQQVVLGESLNDRDPQIGTSLLDKDPNANRPDAPFIPVAKLPVKGKVRNIAITPIQVQQGKTHYANVVSQMTENEDIVKELISEGSTVSEAWKQVLGPKEVALIDKGFTPESIKASAEAKLKDLDELEAKLGGSIKIFKTDDATEGGQKFSTLVDDLNETNEVASALQDAVNELDTGHYTTKADQDTAVKEITKDIKDSAAETADQLDAELREADVKVKQADKELSDAFDEARGISPTERAEITAKHTQELNEPFDKGKGNNEEDFLRQAEEIHGTEAMSELREIVATHNGDGGVADARVNEDIPNTPDDIKARREEVLKEELELEGLRTKDGDAEKAVKKRKADAKKLTGNEEDLHTILTKGIDKNNNEIDYATPGPQRPVIFNESYVDGAYVPD